ncbi:hypothetical protein DZC72_04730 [Maribacter algicola]|uniref:DUF5723 domain-containing protein n=1 Tax=Maribacter algicola TaxID=2498892 RepID=A0A426RLS8_9FLAO|nr:DUF5723 family protein [Maribacter algicola]RRQ49894.1 hypothetical protein DZC72_04730 [Maribacter algicola]
MKYAYILFLFILWGKTFGQSYSGLFTDNFSGIHNTIINPGSLADSRTKWELNLFSINSVASTDYTPLTLGNITSFIENDSFDSLERLASDTNNFLINLDVLGPSIQFSLNEKNGLALFTRIRAIGNVNNINGTLFESVYDGFANQDFDFVANNMDFTTHAWAEIGLSYGSILLQKKYHRLKGGISLKYLLGGGAIQGSSTQLNGQYDSSIEEVSLNGDLSYAFSATETEGDVDYFDNLSPGYGFDFGVVYEFRTPSSLAPSNGDNPRGFNQYKLRMGLSFLDIGKITYRNTESSTYQINATFAAQDLEEDFISAIEDQVVPQTLVNNQAWKLPGTINLNVDYWLTKQWYLNLNINQGLLDMNATFNNNPLNLITLTPRYESRIFGAYLPISNSKLSGTSIGLGLRLGPLLIGSGSLFSNLGNNAQLADIFLGLKIPVYHKRKSKDFKSKKQ